MNHTLKNAHQIVAAAYGEKFGVKVLIQGQVIWQYFSGHISTRLSQVLAHTRVAPCNRCWNAFFSGCNTPLYI